jgi:hypothetical protein
MRRRDARKYFVISSSIMQIAGEKARPDAEPGRTFGIGLPFARRIEFEQQADA